MHNLRWDRIGVLCALLALPIVLRYLRHNLVIPEFSEVPLIGIACQDPETKSLILLGILLLGIVMVARALRS